jgi:hypothetical protein
MGPETLTVWKQIEATCWDGRVVTGTGTLWMNASRRGRFEVEYNGMRRTDGRSDYTNEAEINFFARRLLLEMTEEDRPWALEKPISTPGSVDRITIELRRG